MSERAKLNIVLAGATAAAIAAVIFAMRGVVLAFAEEPVPTLLTSLCILSVMVSLLLMMTSAAIRRKSPSGDR